MIKLQHMSIIFVIIMIPIVLVLSYYISTQIDTINLQTQYNTKLNDATHDAMEAFQINTRNNEYSTVADSLKRDVAASVNTFYTSLATNMGVSGVAREELQPYIPAVLCTMYDGFYLSSPTKRVAGGEAEDVLKQYTYYTARYIGDNTDVTINYSLDSYISVYGIVNGMYVARSGYLIQYGTNGLTKINGEELNQYSVYNYSEDDYIGTGSYRIKDGMIWITNALGNEEQYPIDSVVYNGQTIGVENNIVVKNENNQYEKKDNAKEALYYFLEAYEFSRYIEEIGLEDEINDATKIQINNNTIWKEGVTNNQIPKPDVDFIGEDPEDLSSGFVNHKRDIIRYSIEDSLQTAFNNFEGVTTYDYQLPKLKEEDWEKIYKNVSVVTFMQGIQVGSKLYNNYSIVTSTGNEEYIDPEEIYFVNDSGSSSAYYRIDSDDVNSTDFTGYRSNMYLQQSKIIGRNATNGDDDDKTGSGYVLKEIAGKEITADYNSIVNAKYDSIYNDDGALLGDIGDTNKKIVYYTALARERYCLMRSKTTSILNTSQTIRTNVYATGQVISETEGNVKVKFSNNNLFPSDKYTLVSVKENDGTETNIDKKGQHSINSELTLELNPNKEYTVTVQATDKYGKIKTDTVRLKTGDIKINTETHWENGYLKFTASTSTLKSGQSISVNYTDAAGEKGAIVNLPVKNNIGESFVSVYFKDPQEVYGNEVEGYPSEYLTIQIKNESGDIIKEQLASPSGIDKEGPNIDLKQENITIEQEKINFYISATDDKSGFKLNESKFEILIFEKNNPDALEGISINGETTWENYNQVSQNTEITGLKPDTEYYLIIKIKDRLGNETTLNTDGKYTFKTKVDPNKEKVPDASVIVNPEPGKEIDSKFNIIAECKPTYWVDGENETVTIILEIVNLQENEYYIEYTSVSNYTQDREQAWKEYETPIIATENDGYFVRLVKIVEGTQVTGQHTTFNIQNIDKQEPIISWWGNPNNGKSQEIVLTVMAKDNGSGIKTFKINGQEYVPQNSYNELKREGPKELQQNITVSEKATIEVEVIDCVGRTKKETIDIRNIDEEKPKVEITGVENSNKIDYRYANKDAEIKINVKAEDYNLRGANIALEDIIVKVGDKELNLINDSNIPTEEQIYISTIYTTQETTNGKIIQNHIITLKNILGDGPLTIELKEGAIKDTAGNASDAITYDTKIIMDNIAPKMDIKTDLSNKVARIETNASDDPGSGVHICQYSIKDRIGIKDEIYYEGTDIYSFNTTFGRYLLEVKILDKAGNIATSSEKTIEDLEIATREEMIYFQKYVDSGIEFTSKTITLLNNIDLECNENNQWNPIGEVVIINENGDTRRYYFKGTFEGNGYTISNMYIDATNGESNTDGLFDSVNGTIKNLTIKGTMVGVGNCGGITSRNGGIIENCVSEVEFLNSGSHVGGIAGINASKIINCKNYGHIQSKGLYRVGGIAGRNTSIIENSSNFADIDASGYEVGGIAGCNGQQNSDAQYGPMNIKIINCYNEGSIKGGSQVGGISGSNTYFVGEPGFVEVIQCENKGDVTGSNEIGGIVGNNSASIEECINNANEISGTYRNIGGIAGKTGVSRVYEALNDKGDKTGFKTYHDKLLKTKPQYAEIYNESSIKKCVNNAKVKSKGDSESNNQEAKKGNNIGGIAGYIFEGYSTYYDEEKGTYKSTIIENCYNTGDVEGKAYAGSEVGGIAGQVNGEEEYVKVQNCYDIGKVTGNSKFGSIVGITEHLGNIINCHYLEGTAEKGIDGIEDTQGNIEVKTVDEMQNNPQFVKTLGIENWKEDHTQEQRVQINNGYPILKWQDGKETVIVTVDEVEFSKIHVNVTVTNSLVNDSSETQYEYYIAEEGNNYELKQTTNDKNYVFTGLKQNQTYYIKVIAKNNSEQYDDNNNGQYVGEAVATTKEWTLKEGDITFTSMPSDWTNTNVTVIMSTNTEYNMQYQIGATTGEWKDYTRSFEVDENTVIYGRLTNNEDASNIATFNVINIDKVAPTVEIESVTDINEDLKQTVEDREQFADVYTETDTSWYNAQETEFTLTTANQFVGFLELVEGGNTFSGKTVYLDKDMDLNNVELDMSEGVFAGTLDGRKHILYNINVTGEGILYSNTGTIQNLIFGTGSGVGKDDGTADSDRSSLIASNSGTVDHCYNVGVSISSTESSGGVSGLIRKNTGTISNCRFMAYIDLGIYSRGLNVGGIASDNGGSVFNCHSSGIIKIDQSNSNNANIVSVGGVVGNNYYHATVDNCVFTGEFNIESSNNYDGYIHNSEVFPTAHYGGIVGYSKGSITNSMFNGKISGSCSGKEYDVRWSNFWRYFR